MTNAPNQHRFRPREHLRRPADFRRVYEARCSAVDGSLMVFALQNGLAWNRVGFSVSKKLIGAAVSRNRAKRVLREAYRLTKSTMPVGFDFVFVPRSPDLPSFDILLINLPRMIADVTARTKPYRNTGDETTT